MGNNPVLVVVAVVILIVAGILIFTNLSRSPDVPHNARNYWDEGDSKLYPYDGNEFPPVKAPSGGEGVRAYVFSCSDCNDKGTRFLGYVQKFTPEGRADLLKAFEENNLTDRIAAFEQSLIRHPDETDWYEKGSPEGLEIQDTVTQRCDDEGGRKKECQFYLE